MIRTIILTAILASCPLASAEKPIREDYVPSPDLAEGWYVRIETSMGQVIARLLPEQAEQSVAHFAALVEGRLEWNDPVTGEERSGRYYDGTHVYRAEAARFFQVGKETSAGGYTPFIYVPALQNQPVNFHQGYRLGNIRVGPKLSAARIVITAASMPGFTNTVTCFGAVVEGQETIFNISSVKTQPNGQPIEPVLIERMRIFSVGDPEPLPDPVPYLPDPLPPAKIELIDPRRERAKEEDPG
jgi:peptidyl-prolyl cis-trans isomerase A (cyclophilin A)